MHISEIQKQAVDLTAKHQWPDGSVDQRFRHLISEVGELARELVRYEQDGKDKADIDRAVGHEIYDIVWNLCDLANQLDINLEKAFQEKLEINAHREWQ